MALDPVPGNLMRRRCLQKPLPEVLILNRSLRGGSPSVFLPGGDPVLLKGIDDIAGIRIQVHLAGAVQCLQRGDGTEKLHPIVCRWVKALRKLALMQNAVSIGVLNDGTVSARSVRISPGRTVTVNDHMHIILPILLFSQIPQRASLRGS